jgi:hypothetical protein
VLVQLGQLGTSRRTVKSFPSHKTVPQGSSRRRRPEPAYRSDEIWPSTLISHPKAWDLLLRRLKTPAHRRHAVSTSWHSRVLESTKHEVCMDTTTRLSISTIMKSTIEDAGRHGESDGQLLNRRLCPSSTVNSSLPRVSWRRI